VDNVLLMVPAADDDVIHPGKGGVAVPNSSIHVPLEGWPRVPQTKRHPLILEQAEGGGDGCLLHICRIHRGAHHRQKFVQQAAVGCLYLCRI
jgi:hypothetical protein